MNAKTIKVIWLKKSGTLNQIYSSGVEFAFLSDKNEQATQFAYCKDYLQDAIMGTVHNKSVSIYGFSFNPATAPKIYFEKTRMIVANSSDAKMQEKIPQVIDFLRQIEKSMKLIRSQITLIENQESKYKDKCFIIESSSRWMLSPPMLSLYTLLIRVGFVHTVGKSYKDTINDLISSKIKPYQKNDTSYMQAAVKGLEQILSKKYAKIFYKDIAKNYPNIDTTTMHNNSGIVNFSQNNFIVNHWKKGILGPDSVPNPKKKKKKLVAKPE